MRAGVAALALALVAAAGCGGDDDGGLSKREFIAKAVAGCEKSEPPEQKALKNAAQAEKAAQAQVDYRRPIHAELAKLDPPEELEADFDEFQSATEKAIDLFEQQVEAASKDDDARYARLNRQLDPLFKQRDRLADEIGFKWCGQPVPPPS
jgi:hypothetical protein